MCAMSVMQQRADFVGHLAGTARSRSTRGYALAPAMISFGLCSRASRSQLVVVDPLVVLADAVGDDVEVLAREVERMAVRQVPAVGEVHAEDRVAGLERREEHRHVGLRARVRLHVGVLGAEERLGARDGERLDDVHYSQPP